MGRSTKPRGYISVMQCRQVRPSGASDAHRSHSHRFKGGFMRLRLFACVAAVPLLIVACSSSSSTGSSSSSSSSSSGSSAGASGRTIKIGLLTSLTGPSAPDYVSTQDGLKARLGVFNAASKDGTKIEFVTVDDASTPQGDLAGAKQFIQQDKAFAVIGLSPYRPPALPSIDTTTPPLLPTPATTAS